MKVISYNCLVLNPQEQKLSTLDREFLGIVHALQIYEFHIIGSPHPIHIFTDHKHLLHCFKNKEILVPVFIVLKCNSQKFLNKKIFILQVKNCLLQTCSVVLQKLNFN